MALNRYVTEMGMGVDVHGRNYTGAAKRAVSDAIRHSSLNFFNAFFILLTLTPRFSATATEAAALVML